MSIDDWMKKTGATPGKLVLVGVLAAVLVAVLVVQYQQFATPQASAVGQRTPKKRPARAPAASRSVEDSKEGAEAAQLETAARWPELQLEEVIAHDPFARPAWIKPPPRVAAESETTPNEQLQQQLAQDQQEAKAAALAKALEKLRQQGTRIVVLSEGDKIARIGEQSVRIGDTIEGFRITDITTAGVVLSPEKSP